MAQALLKPKDHVRVHFDDAPRLARDKLAFDRVLINEAQGLH